MSNTKIELSEAFNFHKLCLILEILENNNLLSRANSDFRKNNGR